jgi:hypothetical protein
MNLLKYATIAFSVLITFSANAAGPDEVSQGSVELLANKTSRPAVDPQLLLALGNPAATFTRCSATIGALPAQFKTNWSVVAPRSRSTGPSLGMNPAANPNAQGAIGMQPSSYFICGIRYCICCSNQGCVRCQLA